MKRNSFKWCVYTFLFLGIGMVSCADEDLMTYEDVPRIYFKYADASSSVAVDSSGIITTFTARSVSETRPISLIGILMILSFFNGLSYDKGNNRDGLIYSIYFTALAEKPSLWAASYSSMTLESTFGAYSNAKMNVIYEACGVTREYFEIDPEDNDPTGKETFTKRFSREISFGMVSLINRYLVKYKNEHGEPLLDEFGEEVKMPLSSIQ